MCRQGTAAICRKFCLWQNKIVFQRSRTGAYAPPHFYAVNHRQMILVRGCYCVSKNVLSHCVASRILCGKIVFDDFRLRLLLRKQKRSRTGAYAPPHFYAVNHRQMILVRGCYSIKLNGGQATAAVRHCFAQQNYLMLKRSQPLRSKPHIMRQNRLLTISG